MAGRDTLESMIEASGVRIGWAELPSHVQAAVNDVLGSPVVEAVSQSGGFSPGTADRVVTASGTRAFVKAVSAAQNPDTPQMHRDEIAISKVLPAGPIPQFLGSYDDGTWVVLVLQDVEGRHPETPWQPDELTRVLALLREIAGLPAPAVLPGAAEHYGRIFGGWQRLIDDPDPGLAARAGWAAQRLPWLRDQDEVALAAVPGNSLSHMDIRADNILLTADGGAVLVDWPYACRGAAWLDAVELLINVRLYSEHNPTELLHDICASHDVPVERVVPVLTGCLGYFLEIARRPPPAGLPTVRAFQQAQADALLAWLPELIQEA